MEHGVKYLLMEVFQECHFYIIIDGHIIFCTTKPPIFQNQHIFQISKSLNI